jgi:hypothetical protein
MPAEIGDFPAPFHSSLRMRDPPHYLEQHPGTPVFAGLDVDVLTHLFLEDGTKATDYPKGRVISSRFTLILMHTTRPGSTRDQMVDDEKAQYVGCCWSECFLCAEASEKIVVFFWCIHGIGSPMREGTEPAIKQSQ